jgi:putative hemolysin
MALLVILGLALLNGLFSLAEFAVVSIRRGRLEEEARRGDRRAARVLALADQPTRFLSTIQIGITVLGIVAGAFGEANLTRDVESWIAGSPMLAAHAHGLALVLVIGGITFVTLVLGELVPKRVGLAYPEGIAKALAFPMRVLSQLASPFVTLLSGTTDLILRPFGRRLARKEEISEPEIRRLIARGAQLGIFHAAEHELVERVFKLGDLELHELMVPRPDMDWLDVRAGVDEVRAVASSTAQDHLPICKGGVDQIVGMVAVADIVKALLRGETPNLGRLAGSPVFVPHAMPAVRLLDTLRRRHQHCAVVVDEFGGTRGMVELDDLLDRILGDLSEAEDEEPDVVRREDGSLLISGSCPAEELRRLLGVERLPGEEEANFATVAGLVLVNLDHLPQIGEVFQWDRYRLEVVDMDHRRIDKLLLTILPEAPAATVPAAD